MAENTDPIEELPEDEINSSSENTFVKPLSESEISQTTPQRQTENMETHAHHLHKAPGHGWKHYIFEFIMLFFAVFCGFLAENFREQQVDKKRATEYVNSFYNDLKTDTA